MESLKRCKQFIKDNEQAAEGNLAVDPNDLVRQMRNRLTDYEWKGIDEVVEIMQPPYLQMKLMQSEAFGLSDFFGSWHFLKCSLHEFENRLDNVTDLASSLLVKMKAYEIELMLNPLLLSAVYLDPRYALTLKGEEKIIARSKLTEIYKRINNKETEDNVSTSSSNKMNKFSSYLSTLAKARNSVAPRVADDGAIFTNELLALEQDFNDFEEEEVLPPKTNILLYWEKKKKHFLKLYKLTNTIMSVPSSQNSVERDFSSFAFIYDAKRTGLDPAMLQNILLIRNNKDVFEKVVAKQLTNTSK